MRRIGVRETPSCAASPFSVTRAPGCSSSDRIISRTMFIRGVFLMRGFAVDWADASLNVAPGPRGPQTF